MKFCFVGGISTVFNYALFFLLLQLEINYLISSASGYILGVFIGFVLNRRFTFESTSKNYAVEITKYFIVYTASLFLGLGFLGLQVHLGINVLLANVFTITLTTMTNFMGCKFFVFGAEFYIKKANFLLYRYKYLIRYITIGVGSIFFELLVIEILNRGGLMVGWMLHPHIAAVLGFLGGVVFSFILNSNINFPVPKNRNMRTFRIFLAISTFSFLLNLALMNWVFRQFDFLGYNKMRFITAAVIFMISYTLHRRFTFVYIKEVGVAVYMDPSEDIRAINSKIKFFPDFIHIDLVDKTYKKGAKVDVTKGSQIMKAWPLTKKMIHIMSKKPSQWINKTYRYADYIIFHVEADEDVFGLIQLCRKYHKKAGISIFYNTSTDWIIKYLGHIDLVQVLGIPNPGYSNQNLEEVALEKLAILNKLKDKYHFEICFDGGVKLTNISKINAKYIVSGSSVLNSGDSVKAIYDLKTNSRYYQEGHIDLKRYTKNEIKRIIGSIDFIKSGTIVGSFANSIGLEGIGDMDIIIIVDKLTKDKFERIVSEFRKLEARIKLDYDYNTIINTTFGPLKFIKDKTAVFHLMIYDIEGHIKHCRESPFTCLDWQASPHYFKAPMSSIWKVTALQPNYFFNSRRSVKEYVRDFSSNRISYREYEFSGNKINEVKKSKIMLDRDRFEFSYHIMKFCMSNFLKLYHKDNMILKNDGLVDKYFRIFPLRKEAYARYFNDIIRIKSENIFPRWKDKDKKILMSFLDDFEGQFRDFFEDGQPKLYFIRHQKTAENKEGFFIGQKTDPGIIMTSGSIVKGIVDFAKTKKISRVYSSPLRRAIETAELVKAQLGIGSIIIDGNLAEMDYGLMDGKNFDYLRKKYPQMLKAWADHEDPRFPEGENTADVVKRLDAFLSHLGESNIDGNSIILTHNVVLRSLIGTQFNAPISKFHKIKIPYLDPIELILAKNGKFYINLTPSQRDGLLKDVEFKD